MAKLIFHVDVNSAYLSWEAARRVANGEPDIRLMPAVIGGDREKRTGVVLAKSIPAKKFGIKTGEPIGMALRKCPDLFMAKPDFRLYEENSKKFMDVCREYAPVVEKASIDECYLDMSGTHRIYPDPIALAHKIKDRIKNNPDSIADVRKELLSIYPNMFYILDVLMPEEDIIRITVERGKEKYYCIPLGQQSNTRGRSLHQILDSREMLNRIILERKEELQ